jgi:hypothetical protein
METNNIHISSLNMRIIWNLYGNECFFGKLRAQKIDIVVLTLFRGVYNIIERHEQIIFLLYYAN